MNPNIEQRPLVSDQIDQLPEKPWVRGQQQNALTGGLSLVKQINKNNSNPRLEAELRKAEFINSQLLVSQKKKEQMIAVLMEENKNMKEKLLKTENDLQRRMSQAKIFRDILQKIGVLQKGDKPQTPEQGQMYLNKFIKYIEDEDHRQKTIFKRRGYHNQSTVEFQFKSSSIDEKGTFSSNLSSTDNNNRPENALRASQKIKQLTRYKKKDTMQQQEKLRQPPVFEALHRKKDNRESTLFPDKKGRPNILQLSQARMQEVFSSDRVRDLYDRFSDSQTFLGGLLTLDDVKMEELCDSCMALLNDLKISIRLCIRLKHLCDDTLQLSTYQSQFSAMEAIVRTCKQNLNCDRATVFLLDEYKCELWSKVASGAEGTIRIPMTAGIAGAVVTSGQMQNIEDAYQDSRFSKRIDIESGYRTKTILAVPIFNQRSGAVMGACQSINKKDGKFSPDDEHVLQTIAKGAGVFLQSVNSIQIEQNSQTKFKTIVGIAPLIYGNLDLGNLLLYSQKALTQVFNVNQAISYFIDHQKKLLVRALRQGAVQTFPIKAGLAGECAKQGKLLNVADSYKHPMYNGKVDIQTTMPIIILPIFGPRGSKAENSILGVCQFVNKRGMKGRSAWKRANLQLYTQELIDLLQTQLSVAFFNCIRIQRLNLKRQKSSFDDGGVDGDYDTSRIFLSI